MSEPSDPAEVEVVRETVVPAAPEDVWETLTDPGAIDRWWDPHPELDIRIVTADPPHRFGVVTMLPGERPSVVEFEIEAVPDGSRVRVTETVLRAASASTGRGRGAAA